MAIDEPYTPRTYWEQRYREGRDSGEGSRGQTGAYKAAYLSVFLTKYDVRSVIDWGCGDGQVLEQVNLYGVQYIGVDVSPSIVERMRQRFPAQRFMTPEDVEGLTADLGLSMDVLFHLPDDSDYYGYLDQLFGSATRYVLIYSTNNAIGRTAPHVRRRAFTPDVAARYPLWSLTRIEGPQTSGSASFYLYEKVSA